MKWLVRAMAVLVGLAALIWLVGALLPAEHETTRRARYPRSPETIYETIRDVAGYAEWRPGLCEVQVLIDSRDDVTRFREHGADGTILYEIVEERPPERMVVRIADEELPFGGTWTYRVEGSEDGAILTITENGVVHHPVFRFFSRFVFTHHAGIETYLRALGRKLGEDVEPRAPG